MENRSGRSPARSEPICKNRCQTRRTSGSAHHFAMPAKGIAVPDEIALMYASEAATRCGSRVDHRITGCQLHDHDGARVRACPAQGRSHVRMNPPGRSSSRSPRSTPSPAPRSRRCRSAAPRRWPRTAFPPVRFRTSRWSSTPPKGRRSGSTVVQGDPVSVEPRVSPGRQHAGHRACRPAADHPQRRARPAAGCRRADWCRAIRSVAACYGRRAPSAVCREPFVYLTYTKPLDENGGRVALARGTLGRQRAHRGARHLRRRPAPAARRGSRSAATARSS